MSGIEKCSYAKELTEGDLEKVTGGNSTMIDPKEFQGSWSKVVFYDCPVFEYNGYWAFHGESAPTACPVCNATFGQDGKINGRPRNVCTTGHSFVYIPTY